MNPLAAAILVCYAAFAFILFLTIFIVLPA
jgi:hypothetical protein